jgi:chitin biosynthesis protein CHS5
VSQLTHLKRVVRSWCARRSRITFEQALEQQGFDRLGIPIAGLERAQKERLTGSLDIIIRPPCIKQSFETVQQDTHRLLEKILSQRAIHLERAAKKSEESSGSPKSS